MKHTIDPPNDPVDFLLTSAECGHARRMLDTRPDPNVFACNPAISLGLPLAPQ